MSQVEPREVATSQSWKHDEFDDGIAIDYVDAFTGEQFDTLKLGLVPDEMEEKWFIYVDGDTLYAVASWTGVTVYRVVFRETATGVEVERAEARKLAGGDPTWHAAFVRFLIRRVLLGEEDVPFPRPT